MSFRRISLVVLATVVTFTMGVVAGSSLMRRTASQVQAPPPAHPFLHRFETTRRAVDQVQLTPEQRARIDEIIRNNQELIADYFRILEPDVQQVFRKMRDSIREELTPDQRQRFEDLLKRRSPKPTTATEKD